MGSQFAYDRFEGLHAVQHDRFAEPFGPVELFAENPELGLPADRAGIVQADLAYQIDFAEPGDDLFDSPCFRLPGMNPCERGLQGLAGGTVRVDIDYAAFHNADRSEKTKL